MARKCAALERVRRPEKLEADRKMPQSGNVYFGSKADLLIPGDYGDSPRIVTGRGRTARGQAAQTAARATPMAAATTANTPNGAAPASARRIGSIPARISLYAAPFTEAILLGNIALRVGKLGEKLKYDAAAMKFTNNEEANRYLNKAYRQGWEPLKLV